MNPTAFRIYDFKSIRDSGECALSGDGITVLAGQNESGKTAVLTALRDFDLEEGKPPVTSDYRPDEKFEEAVPRVAVRFTFPHVEVRKWLEEEKSEIPESVMLKLTNDGYVWIVRDLDTGKFGLEDQLSGMWTAAMASEASTPPVSAEEEKGSDVEVDVAEAEKETALTLLSESQFAAFLRDYWPSFVYFDSFEDTLPRSVVFSDLRPSPGSTQAQSGQPKTKAPQSVKDFVTLAGVDLELLEKYSTEEKSLGNYLSSRGALITGEFLSYWKQRVDGEQSVNLRVHGTQEVSSSWRFMCTTPAITIRSNAARASCGSFLFTCVLQRHASGTLSDGASF